MLECFLGWQVCVMMEVYVGGCGGCDSLVVVML